MRVCKTSCTVRRCARASLEQPVLIDRHMWRSSSMNSTLTVDPENKEVTDYDQPRSSPKYGVPASGRSFVPEASAELLRTIAGVLDIRAVFPRISEIVK